MTTNTAAILNATRPNMYALFGISDPYGAQYSDIFGAPRKSNLAIEVVAEFKFLETAGLKPEGSPSRTSDMGQRILTQFEHLTMSQATSMTKECMDDNQYKTQFPQQAKALRNSLNDAKNILGANVLLSAFNPAFTGGDGQTLCSTAHPIDGGTYANTFAVGVGFSEASIENMITNISMFRDQAGLLTKTKLKKLIVGPQLEFAASRLTNSQYRTGTNNNDISAIYHGNYVPEGVKVNQYFMDSTNYYGITDADYGLMHFKKQDIELASNVDFLTRDIQWLVTERYSFGAANYRSVFGVQGV